MKRITTICAIALCAIAITSCKDDKKGGKLDPNAMISLRPAAGVKAAENPEHLTAKQIVEQATGIGYWNRAITTHNALGRGFAPVQRDIANLRLLMWGIDIIKRDGSYAPDFIEAEDVILDKWDQSTNKITDTIAYIPNAVLRTAQPLIKSAHAEGNYTECYRLFDQAFTFIPITGKEWLELKAQGKN